MPYPNPRWIIGSAAVLFTFVAVVGYESFKKGTNDRDIANTYGVDLSDLSDSDVDRDSYYGTNWTQSNFVLAIFVTVDSLNLTKGASTLGFHFEYDSINNLTTDDGLPNVPVRLLRDGTIFNFPAKVFMPLQTASIDMDGDINHYPFDIYTREYIISAFSSPSNESFSGEPLPMTIYAEGAIQGFKIDITIQGEDEDGSSVTITFKVSRSLINKAFSVVIILAMWCLSGGIFVAAMSVWFRERKDKLLLITISTALLFALPNVRNSQPGIPALVGTTSDMVGFFWNLLLLAVSVFSLIIHFVVKFVKNLQKPVEKPPL